LLLSRNDRWLIYLLSAKDIIPYAYKPLRQTQSYFILSDENPGFLIDRAVNLLGDPRVDAVNMIGMATLTPSNLTVRPVYVIGGALNTSVRQFVFAYAASLRSLDIEAPLSHC
jgi:hypothetical protein